MTTLSCPHCGFSKDLPAEKLPKEAARVTCPQCRVPFTYTPPAAASRPQPSGPAGLAEQVTITCPHCNNKRQVPRDKIPTRLIKTTCPACQKPFPFDGSIFRSEVTLQRPQMHPSLAPTPQPGAPPPRPKQLASIGELLRRSWQIFTRRILTLIGINLLGFALAGICSLLLGATLDKLQEFSGNNPLVTIPAVVVLLVFALAVTCAIAGGMTYAVVDDTLGVRESLGYGIQRWRAFLWLFTLLGFVLAGGYMAFFIPGLLFTVWFIFAQFVLAHDDVGGMDALLLSRAYVRGHGWAVLGRLLLLAVIIGALSIIPLLGILFSLLLGPFALIYYHEIYRDLHAMKAPAVYDNSRGEKAKYLLAGTAGYLLVPVAALLLIGPTLYRGLDLFQPQNTTQADRGNRATSPAATRQAQPAASGALALTRSTVSPGAILAVRFDAPPGLPGDAWVGIVPAAIPHGDEAQNDQHDLSYQYLNGRRNGTLRFTAPLQAGAYDLRMHDTDNNGREIASITFQVDAAPQAPLPTQIQTQTPPPLAAGTGPRLELDQYQFAPGAAITLRFSGLPDPAMKDRIGLFALGADNQSFGEARYLAQKAGGELHFTAPLQAGTYEFRLFRNWPQGGSEPVARSQPISVGEAAAPIQDEP